MSLITILQNAAEQIRAKVPLSVPTSVTGDQTTRFLLRLANNSVRQMARRHDWQILTKEQTFTSLAQSEQTNMLPTDYGRMLLKGKIWDRSRNMPLSGPVSADEWQEMISGQTAAAYSYWRIRGGQIITYPVLEAGHTLAFEYISKLAVRSGSNPREVFVEATDTTVLPEELIELDIVWRFGASTKSFDYGEDMATFERELEKIASHDRGPLTPVYPHRTGSRQSNVWPGTIVP